MSLPGERPTVQTRPSGRTYSFPSGSMWVIWGLGGRFDFGGSGSAVGGGWLVAKSRISFASMPMSMSSMIACAPLSVR